MKSITLTIEITDEEFDVLNKIKENGHAEFKDSEFTWDEYYENKKEVVYSDPDVWNEERFLRRNFGGTKKEALSLYEKGLVDMPDDAWYLTFELTDLGRKFFE